MQKSAYAILLRFYLVFMWSMGWAYAVPLCQSQSEQLKFWGGTLMQMLSFQAGFAADMQVASPYNPKSTTFSPSVGAHAGVTYMNPEDTREFDYGWRIKYLFAHSSQLDRNSHYVGAMVYLHPFPNPYHRLSGAIQTHTDCLGVPDGYPTPFSFVIGSGAVIDTSYLGQSVGGYIEVGVALFKWFRINSEILYRVHLCPHNAIETTRHSINIVFNIL